METLHTELERHQIIQLTAYCRWQQRGSPFGEPDIDWFRAEEDWKQQNGQQQNEDAPAKPAMVSVAEAIGSALGAATGFVNSVGGLFHSEETLVNGS